MEIFARGYTIVMIDTSVALMSRAGSTHGIAVSRAGSPMPTPFSRAFIMVLEFLSLTGKVKGKRDRGKLRITFLDSLCNSATGGQSKSLIFLKLSDDRDVWRGIAANVCSRSGT